MFLQLLILSLILVAIAFIGLAFNILFRKNGKFPETGVGHNPEMRKRGLSCAKTEEIREWNLRKGVLEAKKGNPFDPTEFTGGCAGCNCH